VQNLAQFQTTSKFGIEYLRNGWRYSKSDEYIFIPRFLPCWVKEVRWNLVHYSWRLSGEIIPTQIDFFRRPYFGP